MIANIISYGSTGWIGTLLGLTIFVAVSVCVIALILTSYRVMNLNIQTVNIRTAMNIARVRLAQGEIEHEEYQRIVEDLKYKL